MAWYSNLLDAFRVGDIKQELAQKNAQNAELIGQLADVTEELASTRSELVAAAADLNEANAARELFEGQSSITMFVDDKMRVTFRSRYHDDFPTILADNDYIDDRAVDDEDTVHLAMILMVSEASGQVLEAFEGTPVEVGDGE